jgi:rod shape-determining protein MreC
VKVIGRDSANPGVVIINKGSSEGIAVGDTAVVENILLGEVIYVDQNTSKVQYLISANAKLPVKKSDESIGLLEGKNGRELSVEQILQSKEIKEGDRIFSSGLEGSFPPDLYIGKIGSISADERSSTKSAQVISPVDWDTIPRFKILLGS